MKNAKTVWIAAVILYLTTSQALAIYIDFRDGQIHDIDYRISDGVRVDYLAPGMQTTVNLIQGGRIQYSLKAFEDSQVNMLDGLIEESLDAYNRSRVKISRGSIGKYLWLHDSSQVELSGGRIGIYLVAMENSHVQISDGSIKKDLSCWDSSYVEMSGGGINDVLISHDGSQVEISGGLIGRLVARDSSRMKISGGSVREYLHIWESTRVELSGGSFGGDLIADESSVLTIKGQDFYVDDVRFGYGELKTVSGGWARDEPTRRLTGTLENGQKIDNDFYIGKDARIVLDPGAVIHADIDVKPNTVNLQSKGNWITCYIRLPIEFNVADIERDSVLLNKTVRSEPAQVDEDQQLAIARFDRRDVQSLLDIGEIELTITGRLTDGTVFEATDTIKVIDKAGKN